MEINKEESYADRRQLFKNIWETAMQINEKDVDTVMTKPKVIKTLRLDEVDRCRIGKTKKERIKNLRTVCEKILDFCDRQDADDMLYDQKPDKDTADCEASSQRKLDVNLKKIKTYPKRKKVKRVKSFYLPKKSSGQQATGERKDDYPLIFSNSFRNNSPVKRRTTLNLASVTQALEVKSNPDAEGSNAPAKGSAARRKLLRKRRTKRKKTAAPNLTPPGPSGRAIVKRIKQCLTDNKITVTSEVYSTNKKPEDKETADGEASSQHKVDVNLKKIKTYPKRKKVKMARRLPKKSSGQQATGERKDDYPLIFSNSFRNNSPVKRRTTLNLASVTQSRALEVQSNIDTEGSNAPTKGSATRCKVLRKRRTKRKKTAAPNLTSPGPSGIDWQDP